MTAAQLPGRIWRIGPLRIFDAAGVKKVAVDDEIKMFPRADLGRLHQRRLPFAGAVGIRAAGRDPQAEFRVFQIHHRDKQPRGRIRPRFPMDENARHRLIRVGDFTPGGKG